MIFKLYEKQGSLQYAVIVSPFIKLDNHVKSIFEKIKATHEVHIILVFGKNEGYKQKSFNQKDFNFFKEFKNISILYNKDLHAKHYCNEQEALITSLNLYDYSMQYNIEYGVHFTKTILNPIDKLFEETEKFTDKLIFEKSDLVFLKKPQYKKTLLGFSKTYQSSTILFDVSKEFFGGRTYDKRRLEDFDIEELIDVGKVFEVKPEREITEPIGKKKKANTLSQKGYCIRTGNRIPFNPERPYSYAAFKSWDEYKNPDYEEVFCHKTGKKSFGNTSMRNPIL